VAAELLEVPNRYESDDRPESAEDRELDSKARIHRSQGATPLRRVDRVTVA